MLGTLSYTGRARGKSGKFCRKKRTAAADDELTKIRRLLPSASQTPPSYIGFPQRFCEAKDLWEEGGGGKGASAQNVVFAVRQIPEKSALNGAPKKSLLRKSFLGKGGTDVISVAFAVRRMPAKGVVFRRGAADRPRTDTPFRYRILSPARLPIPPRRHMRRPEKDGAGVSKKDHSPS